MKAITIFRKVSGANGSCILQPLASVATEALADEFIAHHKGFISEISQCHATLVTPEGPRGLMPIPQLLNELGIMNIELLKMTAEVKESNLVVPRNVVTLQ